jgi:hypothetical protein
VTISFWDYFRIGAPLTIVSWRLGRCGCGCNASCERFLQETRINGRREE